VSTLAHLAMLEHHASAGIMLAAESDPQPVGLMVITISTAAVAVIAGRALIRLVAVFVEAVRLALETMRLALRLAVLLAGVLVVFSISVTQLLPT
jgi:hypothetical protein